MMKILRVALLLLLALNISLAQSKPPEPTKETKPSINLTLEQSRAIADALKAIELAQAELKAAQANMERAQASSRALYFEMAARLKVDLDKYELQQREGVFAFVPKSDEPKKEK